MKTMHPARKRILVGVLLLAATFFYAFAGTCGMVGILIARASAYLLGQTGSTLVAFAMMFTGLALVIPHGAVGRFLHWAWSPHKTVSVAKVLRQEGDIEAIVRRVLRDERSHGVVEAEVEVEKAAPTPVVRRKLDDVRTALVDLGYKKSEYEPLIAKMDPSLDFEILVKSALKDLRAGAN